MVLEAVNTFLVGGAVRDTLLGYPVHERDWVVVGATVLQKLKRGRPLGYYQLRFRLWLEDLGLLRSTFIRQGQVWDIGRRVRR